MPFGQYHKGRTNTAPLRRIVEVVSVDFGYFTGEYAGVEVNAELLDCGHIVRIREDFGGQTNAERRRCTPCQKGEPVRN